MMSSYLFIAYGLFAAVLLFFSFCILYHALRFGNRGDSTRVITYFFIALSLVLFASESALLHYISSNLL